MKNRSQSLFFFLIATLVLIFSCNTEDDVPNDKAEITSFEINGVNGIIREDVVEVTLPRGTKITSLFANVVVSEKATISPNPEETLDYRNNREFIVTAEDGVTKKTYKINVVFEEVIPTADNPYPEGIFILRDLQSQNYELDFRHPSGAISTKVFQAANNGKKISDLLITDIIPHNNGYLIFGNLFDNTGGKLMYTDLKLEVIKEELLEKCNVGSGDYAQIGNKVYYTNMSIIYEVNQVKNKTYVIDVEKQILQKLDKQILKFFVTSSDGLYYTDIIRGLYKVTDLNTLEAIDVEDFEDYSNSFVLDDNDVLWSISRTKTPGNFVEAKSYGLGTFDYNLNLVAYDIKTDVKTEGVSTRDINRESSLFVKNNKVYLITNQNTHMANPKKELQKLNLNNNTVKLEVVHELPKTKKQGVTYMNDDGQMFDFGNTGITVLGGISNASLDISLKTYYYDINLGTGEVSDKVTGINVTKLFPRKAL